MNGHGGDADDVVVVRVEPRRLAVDGDNFAGRLAADVLISRSVYGATARPPRRAAP